MKGINEGGVLSEDDFSVEVEGPKTSQATNRGQEA